MADKINPNLYTGPQLADKIEAGQFTLEYLRNPSQWSSDKEKPSQEISVALNEQKAKIVENLLLHRKATKSEGTDWEKVTKENSMASYTQFIQSHPNSSHKEEAEKRLCALRDKQKIIDYEKVKGIGATKAEMQQFVDNYPDTTEAQEIQEKLWSQCVTIADYEGFGEKNQNSPHCIDIPSRIQALRILQQTEDEAAWNAAKKSGNLQQIREYLQKYSLHTTEANLLIDEFDNRAWMDVKDSGEIAMIENYLDEYSKGRTPLHKQEAEDEKRKLEDIIINEPIIMAEINQVLADSKKDVLDYLDLCRQYPSKKAYIKNWMINDMKITPGRYQRDEMYMLMFKVFKDGICISEPLFSPEEIIRNEVLSVERVKWIKAKPTKKDDDSQEVTPREDCFDTEKNNTDVFFFGVPGSGKTSVLAGLFSVVNFGDSDSFKYLSKGCMHKGYNYAVNLKKAVDNHVFPARTLTKYMSRQRPQNPEENIGIGIQPPIGIGVNLPGNAGAQNSVINNAQEEPQEEEGKRDLFIQIIDAVISNLETGRENKISIVEMPGERTLQFAAAKIDNKNKNVDMSMLGEGTERLFNNDNDKLIFFVIDPNAQKEQPVEMNGATVQIKQAETLTAVADFLVKMVEVGNLKKLKSVHVIMSKSDLIPQSGISMEDSINRIMHESDYQQLVNSLKKLCSKDVGDVNIHCGRKPKLFTFSLGRILPGDMFNYDAEDSIKILRVIKANTLGVGSATAWDTICGFVNKKLSELM